jgi:hypothetical protein
MTTSKQDKKDKIFDPLKSLWQKILIKLDANSRRTAIGMACMLLIVACFYTVNFIDKWNNPVKQEVFNGQIFNNMLPSIQDSVAAVDKIMEMLMLIQIQNELEEMMKDTTKIDSLRIEELMKILNVE